MFVYISWRRNQRIHLRIWCVNYTIRHACVIMRNKLGMISAILQRFHRKWIHIPMEQLENSIVVVPHILRTIQVIRVKNNRRIEVIRSKADCLWRFILLLRKSILNIKTRRMVLGVSLCSDHLGNWVTRLRNNRKINARASIEHILVSEIVSQSVTGTMRLISNRSIFLSFPFLYSLVLHMISLS